eukprot:6200794-Pleurochrysis_carterae.AAC.1
MAIIIFTKARGSYHSSSYSSHIGQRSARFFWDQQLQSTIAHLVIASAFDIPSPPALCPPDREDLAEYRLESRQVPRLKLKYFKNWRHW